QPFAVYSGAPQSIFVLVSLLVCLIPTTIGGLLSAIGIAGMDRMIQRNVIAMSGRAVEASGDVDVLLLDKTGTITLGNREATMFYPCPNVTESELANAAQLASLADETPEGRSIVVLAKDKYGLRGREFSHRNPIFLPFSAQTRMSGVDLDGLQIRKGAPEAILKHVAERGQQVPKETQQCVADISNGGGTPLLVAENARILGVVALTDIVKGGMRERFEHLRAMGIRTMMITGDNPLTAAAIARQAGVDDFLAEARPEDKMALIKREQAKGKLVAMTGDGTNDAPALAQADVGVAMNTGTQAAKEAGNMVDLDSNPTKLIEIVEIGKQLLIALWFTLVTTLMFGLIYPLGITGLAQLFFRDRANGQLITKDGKLVGSRIIGQAFTGPAYFHSRPSAAGTGYDATSSGGSNLAPTNKNLLERVKGDVQKLQAENPNAAI